MNNGPSRRQVTDAVDVVGFKHVDMLVDGGTETSKLSTEPVADKSQPYATSASNVIAALTQPCNYICDNVLVICKSPQLYEYEIKQQVKLSRVVPYTFKVPSVCKMWHRVVTYPSVE